MNAIKDSGGNILSCESTLQACKDKAPVDCGTEATHCYVSLIFLNSIELHHPKPKACDHVTLLHLFLVYLETALSGGRCSIGDERMQTVMLWDD